jgi:threonine synthase
VPEFEADSPNPFVRYRWLLDSYRLAIGRGWSDADFVALAHRLDEAVGRIAGQGFAITPVTRQIGLAAATSLGSDLLWVKDETGNVGGTHKARHLFGVLLHLALEDDNEGELAIASCGNAALAAAVVAKAANRPIRVFIPNWADPLIVARLKELEARIEVSERRPDEQGDPTYLRLIEAVGRGATPFSVQATVTPTTHDGGRTIGWELAEQLATARVSGTIHLFVQVGGGALAAAVWAGLNDGIREQWLGVRPVLHTVQTDAAAPLNRAWRRLVNWSEEQAIEPGETDLIEGAISRASDDPDSFMWPWEEVTRSAASGILDDMTYDWIPVMEAMLRSGGRAQVVSEEMILRANELAQSHTSIKVDHTGSAGVAALLDPTVSSFVANNDHVVLLFTGRDRA